MMQILKSYTSKYILNAGKAITFLTGSHQQNFMCLERIVLFEPADKTALIKWSEPASANASEWEEYRKFLFDKEPTLLESFTKEIGFNSLQADICSIADHYTDNTSNVILEPQQPFHNVMYLKRNHPESFDWLYKNTRHKPLKDLIDMSKLIIPAKSPFDS